MMQRQSSHSIVRKWRSRPFYLACVFLYLDKEKLFEYEDDCLGVALRVFGENKKEAVENAKREGIIEYLTSAINADRARDILLRVDAEILAGPFKFAGASCFGKNDEKSS